MSARSLIQFEKTEDLAAWYDQKYTEMGGGWSCPPEESNRLLDWAGIEVDKKKILLDIGCGEGHFWEEASKRVFAMGIDISEVILKKAYSRYPAQLGKFTFQKVNIENTVFTSGHFDYLTSIGSIEHVINLDAALDECYRILNPKGKFLCLVPNELWPHMDQPQEQTHTDEGWTAIFKKAGFKIEKFNRRSDLTDFLLTK